MTIDVDLARSLTPGCANVVHFNNAGASLATRPVLDAVIGHLEREAAVGGYEAAAEAADRLAAVTASVARLLGADADEVALVESATAAWDAAFYSVPLQPGDRILTGRAEYASNVIALLQAQQRCGAVVELIDDDEHGQISLDQLRDRIDSDVKLVALTHVPTGSGLVNPAAEVGAIAHQAGALFLLDACQSAGQLPLDVAALRCDMLSGTGRKFIRGPRGTGFLYVSSAALERLQPHILDMRSATWNSSQSYEIAAGAQRFESWEASIATRLGLGVAVDQALGWGVAAIAARNDLLAARLREGLSSLEGLTVRDKGREQCAIVTFTVEGWPSADVSARLRDHARINTSVVTPVAAQYDLPHRGVTDLVRASVHYFNTDDEVDLVVHQLRAICQTRPR